MTCHPAPQLTPPAPAAIRFFFLLTMLGAAGTVAALEPAGGTGVTLKLDHEMTRQGRMPPEVPSEMLSPAIQVGIDDLTVQAATAENLARALDRENRQWKAELSAREEIIGELEQTLASQDDIIRLLEDRARQPAPAAAPAPAEPPATGVRTWGPAGWDPRALRWGELRSFMQSPTAVERALAVLVVLLLGYAIYLRLRTGRDRPEHVPVQVHAARRDNAERAAPVPRERDSAGAGPGVPQRARQGVPGDHDATMQLPPLEFTSASTPPPSPPGSPAAPAQPRDTDPPTVRLVSRDTFELPDPPSETPAPPDEPPAGSPSAPRAPRKRADPAALREVDALIAFEHFEDAAELLAQAMADNPDNPEYRLRSLYIRNALGDYERFANDESILQAMMNGPMSDTLGRVLQTGRGLMPDNPLFESKEQAPEAEPPTSPGDEDIVILADEDIDDFNESTFIPLELDPDDEKPKPG